MRPILQVLVAAAVSLAPPLAGQTDEETLARYRLTEETLVKFTRAARGVIAAVRADSTALGPDEGDGSPQSLAEITAAYERRPALKRAITDAAMTTREYAVFVMSMLQAAMAAWIVERDNGKFAHVPAGIPLENVWFYQRHQAELERLGDELRGLEHRDAEPEEDAPPEGRDD
jgi:hypothetical protein